MYLAEMLMDRKDLVNKIARIKEDIVRGAVTRADMKPPYSIATKIDQYEELMQKLEDFNTKIDKSNAQNLTDLLNKLRIMDSRIDFYKSLRNMLLQSDRTFYGGEVEYSINCNINIISSVINNLESERRVIDRQVQKKNWQVEIE